MHQTPSQRSDLKRAIPEWRRRRSGRRANHTFRAAHPVVAGALASFAARFANGAERVIENGAFIAVALGAACVLLWARAQGWIA